MNYLVANSRGAGLRELIPKAIMQRVVYKPRATINQLSLTATSVHSTSNVPNNTHIYILAGIPDITKKLNSKDYQEVIFTENP